MSEMLQEQEVGREPEAVAAVAATTEPAAIPQPAPEPDSAPKPKKAHGVVRKAYERAVSRTDTVIATAR